LSGEGGFDFLPAKANPRPIGNSIRPAVSPQYMRVTKTNDQATNEQVSYVHRVSHKQRSEKVISELFENYFLFIFVTQWRKRKVSL